MPKLHELLAVHSNLETQFTQTIGQLQDTFTKKHAHFGEKLKVFHSNEPDVAPLTEEQSALQTTVAKELDWITKFIIQAIDVSHQIDRANMSAVADLDVGDPESGAAVHIALSVPATTLLELEKRLVEIQKLFNTIPTLDPVKAFEPDPSFRVPGVYKAREVVKFRTAKKQKPLVRYDATDKHPAQVQLISDDIPVGKICETEWSGMITPAEKSLLMGRVDEMIRAVKQARARANQIETDSKARIGRRIMDFLLTGH